MAASRDYERHLATLGVDVQALTLDASGTLAAANEPKGAGASFQGGDALEIGRVLGEGGMGVVHAAVQRNLGREVAVKQLPSGASGVRARALISEAVVTGQLEHPNVVPIHSLTSDADGRPALVMKLVRGSLWSDYLAEPERLTRDHPGDALEFHVGVLMTLCNAVEFAHSRGILHRDIKPCNVMIGRFGEIYLLDWGLAAAIHDDAPAALPRVSEICEPAGSPPYMAPEMAAADAEVIGVRSDVYLLGAALHEVLTSRAPHQGANLLETLRSAFRADPPKLGDDVPRELAEICRRALAFDPMDRFAGAGDLRAALSRYLSHRAARVLGTEADRSAEAYQRALDRNDDDADRLGTEARFAYQLALREWPDNVDAQQGLQRLLRLMVKAEIGHGHVDAARHYLAELDARDEALEAELCALEERQERERRRVHALERLRDDADLAATGAERLRRLIFIGTGTVLFVITLTGLRLAGLFTLTPGWLVAVMLAVTAMSTLWLHKRAPNDAARRVRRGFLGTMLYGAAYLAVAALAEGEVTAMLTSLMFLFGSACIMGFGLLHGSGILPTMAFFATGTALSFFPEWRGLVLPIGLMAAFGTMAYSSRRVDQDNAALDTHSRR